MCDLDEPHYYMKMSFAKVITQPSQKIVIGPSHLVVEGVEIPLYIPFGFVPNRPQRATGLLMPTIGEESARGFYLRDLGMYFVLGDYFDLSVTGDIFTLGSTTNSTETSPLITPTTRPVKKGAPTSSRAATSVCSGPTPRIRRPVRA